MGIPESELHFDFVRSSGPGGQKVNKTSSKVQLRWKVDASASFSVLQRMLIASRLANRINKQGEIVLSSDRLRSQSQNKAFVVEQLERLVTSAIKPRVKRVATKPTRSSKRKRVDTKKKRSHKKTLRRTLWNHE